MTKPLQKKTMIIVWKWKDLIPTTETALAKNYSHFLEDIRLAEEKCYKVYRVQKSNFTEQGELIAIRVSNGGKKTQALLDAILKEKITAPKNTILFLHKSDDYKQADVERIAKKFSLENRCFLFGEGSDYIYYKAQKKGLLGRADFYVGVDKEKEKFVSVLNNRNKKTDAEQYIKQPYFDNVWNYYAYSFKKNLYYLKEDLFTYLLSYYFEYQDAKIKEVLGEIKQNKLLELRLKSLCGVELSKEESKYIEKKDQGSYIFNDSYTKILSVYGKEIAQQYKILKKEIKQGLLSDSDKTVTFKEHIKEIRHKFDNLLSSMPEAIFY